MMRQFSSKKKFYPKTIELEDIPNIHTKELLKQLKWIRLSIRRDLEPLGLLNKEADIFYDALKAELAKREHIPNKTEARKIRQQKAKEKKNR